MRVRDVENSEWTLVGCKWILCYRPEKRHAQQRDSFVVFRVAKRASGKCRCKAHRLDTK